MPCRFLLQFDNLILERLNLLTKVLLHSSNFILAFPLWNCDCIVSLFSNQLNFDRRGHLPDLTSVTSNVTHIRVEVLLQPCHLIAHALLIPLEFELGRVSIAQMVSFDLLQLLLEIRVRLCEFSDDFIGCNLDLLNFFLMLRIYSSQYARQIINSRL